MPRQDDPTISGDLQLYRRIPPWGGRVGWSEAGYPIPSSFNFKDAQDELSLHIAGETSPDAILAGPQHLGFGLISLTARQVRDICRDDRGPTVFICRDEEDPADGHVLVCGKISSKMAKRLSQAALWVEGRWPARLDPITGESIVDESP